MTKGIFLELVKKKIGTVKRETNLQIETYIYKIIIGHWSTTSCFGTTDIRIASNEVKMERSIAGGHTRSRG
jgi:hypothetical protein